MSKVQITSTAIPGFRYSQTNATIRAYVDRSFVTSDGITIQGGAVGSGQYFQEWPLTFTTLTSGPAAIVPNIQLDSTTDAQTAAGVNAVYTFVLTENGSEHEVFQGMSFRVPPTFPGGSSATWAQLILFNQSAGVATYDKSTYSRQDVNNLLNGLSNVTYLNEINVTGYASVSAAVAAIGSQIQTLVIPNVQMVTSSLTIPSSVTVKFTGAGQLNIASGQTVTFNCPVIAQPVQIFSGAGLVVFGIGYVKEVFAEWWGADPTGVADSAPAINAMILAVPTQSGIRCRLLGKYLINSTLNIINNAAATGPPFKYSMVIEGAPAWGQGYPPGGRLIWNGNATTPMFKVWSRENTFRQLYITAAPGKTLMSAFEMDRASGSITNVPTAPACTNNRFFDIFVYGDDSTHTNGLITDAFVIGRSGNPSNNEFFHFENVNVFFATNAGVNILQYDFQSKKHRFWDCGFGGCKYGVYFQTGDGTFLNCNLQSNTTSAFAFGVGDAIEIIGCTGEGNNRLLITSSGSSPSGGASITFSGCRFATDAINADGKWVIWSEGGPVIFNGCTMGTGAYDPNFKIAVGTFSPGNMVISIGNVWPNQQPFDLNTNYYTVLALMDRGTSTDGSSNTILPYSYPGQQGLRWTEVKSVTPAAPTVAVNAISGNLNGAYLYKVTFITPLGETAGGTESASVSPVNQQVNLTNIPTGGSLGFGFVTGRKIYRTTVGGASGTEKLVTTINDNTTTTYTDNLADGSLGAAVPTSMSYNAASSDSFILVDSTATNVVVHLPSNSSWQMGTISPPGKRYFVKKFDSSTHTVTIDSPSTNGVELGSYTIPSGSLGGAEITWAGGSQLSGSYWVTGKF